MNAALESALAAARALAPLEAELERLDETAAAHRALAALAQADLLRWCVPASFGGADAGGLCAPSAVSVRALSLLRTELARIHGMLDVMFVMQGLGSYPLALGGGALAQRELPRVARGELVAAFALTEPGAGSSVGEVSSRARPHAGGWTLDGHKTFISNAGIAHAYAFLARTSDDPREPAERALSMFWVPADAPGLRVERFEVLSPHPIGELHLTGVELGSQHLIGDPGRGLALALGTLARFRTSVAAAACGFARRALHEARAHLIARSQFGKPLAANQALRFDVAEMDTRLRASELLVAEAAAASDADVKAVLQVARAKYYATETASYVCDRAVQLLGGLGVRRGHPVERLFREVRALRIYEGTSEVQKLIIAKELFARA
jgi:acyl-CoA dehydrogenase